MKANFTHATNQYLRATVVYPYIEIKLPLSLIVPKCKFYNIFILYSFEDLIDG